MDLRNTGYDIFLLRVNDFFVSGIKYLSQSIRALMERGAWVQRHGSAGLPMKDIN
jgi:hypothetical protein